MRIRDCMTGDPVTCTPDTTATEIAKSMAENDCGVIPVVREGNRPVGVVTDRDIAIRVVARDETPGTVRAADIMTEDPVTVRPDAGVEEGVRTMKENRLRRLMVVDDERLVGVVAQADLALEADAETVGDVVETVSEPTERAAETTRA